MKTMLRSALRIGTFAGIIAVLGAAVIKSTHDDGDDSPVMRYFASNVADSATCGDRCVPDRGHMMMAAMRCLESR
ncbi:hypothetical protein PTE30175_04499 [Pandoraea terrae]|uniref:Transmembrane protein n=1 Tax=Pandoraea terrae TaxID=1537710 RepID=A0A5E4YM90_9BURK|nr:hypothetical protein [Pandoraea terrae]VVE49438.1 hypothetical protein PTE30175_04499 [Pandoraea terrae]